MHACRRGHGRTATETRSSSPRRAKASRTGTGGSWTGVWSSSSSCPMSSLGSDFATIPPSEAHSMPCPIRCAASRCTAGVVEARGVDAAFDPDRLPDRVPWRFRSRAKNVSSGWRTVRASRPSEAVRRAHRDVESSSERDVAYRSRRPARPGDRRDRWRASPRSARSDGRSGGCDLAGTPSACRSADGLGEESCLSRRGGGVRIAGRCRDLDDRAPEPAHRQGHPCAARSWRHSVRRRAVEGSSELSVPRQVASGRRTRRVVRAARRGELRSAA